MENDKVRYLIDLINKMDITEQNKVALYLLNII